MTMLYRVSCSWKDDIDVYVLYRYVGLYIETVQCRQRLQGRQIVYLCLSDHNFCCNFYTRL